MSADNPLDDVENICFIDFETRAEPGNEAPTDDDVRDAGTYRYAEGAFATILTYGVANKPVQAVELLDFDGDFMKWSDVGADLRKFHERVERGEAWYAAWHMGFDRAIWNRGTHDFPILAPAQTIDVMAQAVASNLPPALEGASRWTTGAGKQEDGKALIRLFSPADGGTPQSHPEEWARFVSYAVRDTSELREVFLRTRPLPFVEWEDYWVSERINERGMGVDLPFVTTCAAMADAEIARLNKELARWTNGQITAVTQIGRITDWVYERLHGHAEARLLLVKSWDDEAEVDPENPEADRKVGKMSLDKSRLEAVLAYFASIEEARGLSESEQVTVDVLTARKFGGGSAFSKFQKMLDQQTGGRLRGQFVFNGAPQTGRYSSRGVQLHNLIRASLGKGEIEAIEFINEVSDGSV